MRICENGIYRDATVEEMCAGEQEELLPYKDRVVARIRAVYSIDDELAIIRQRDTKPEEFEVYNAFVEQIKLEEKAK